MRGEILAYHIVFCTYGFWLPNDPRGSWSEDVFSVALQPFGDVVPVHTKRSVAHVQHDHHKRLMAKKSLQFPPVRLTGHQALAAAHAFEQVVSDISLTVYACSIMPDHIHLVTAKHERPTESIVQHLKSAATKMMNERNLHPLRNQHSPWARSYWDVYLHTDQEICRAIKYVNENPIRDGLKPQNWRFITPYQ